MPKIPGADKQKYLERLRAGDTHAVAGRASGHPRTSYARIAETDEGFRTAIAAAAKEGIDALEQELVDIGLGKIDVKGNGRIIALFGVLKARDPSRWVEKRQLDLANADNKPLEVAVGVPYRAILETLRRVGAESTDGNVGSGASVPGASEVLPAGDK